MPAEGIAYCWGGNSESQLGDGSRTDRPTPVPVAGGHTFVSISTGFLHTCGLTARRRAYCWGYGDHGALGSGYGVSFITPMLVAGGHRFVSISAGTDHTCGVTTAGKIYCWGANSNGQLGIGSTGGIYDPPRLVHTPEDERFITVSARGNRFTCALTDEGKAYCWGKGDQGQLGYGGTDDKLIPTEVAGGHTFTTISVGTQHTCALTEEGEAYCWGDGHHGQLGHGGSLTGADRHEPYPVNTSLRFKSIKAGDQNTCALTHDGTAYCWGTNSTGVYGNGKSTLMSAPLEPVNGGPFIEIALSRSSHACGIATDGLAYCWGKDSYGNLGNGSSTQRYEPYPVSTFRYSPD